MYLAGKIFCTALAVFYYLCGVCAMLRRYFYMTFLI